jgi:RNA polymerase sigma-70 factor (ECF subfamily)
MQDSLIIKENRPSSLYQDDKTLLDTYPMNTNDSAAVQKKDATTFDDLLTAVGQTKNRDAFVRLFEYFAPRVKSFLMRGGFNKDEADELAQETMLTVWNKAGSYDSTKASASTWIFTIARNKKIDNLRKSSPVELDPHDPLLMPVERDTPLDYINRTQEIERLAKAIKNLPEEQASLVRKSFFESKSHGEISEETGIPLGTVKSRIRLALDKLHHLLGKQEHE